METKYMGKKSFIYLLAGLCFAFISCKDDWNNHFDADSSIVPDVSLMEMISKDPSLSKFAEILKLTGADSYLTSNQTYTVWAPTDEALANVDMSDMDELNRIVNNHIARYTSPTSTPAGDVIYMLNGKTMAYSADGSYNGAGLLQTDIVTQNGVLHVIDKMIPYQYNFLEYISTHENYDSLYKYIMYFAEKRYDESLSTVYDSVFVDYNPMLTDWKYGIGYLGTEDSVYTMILPDNAAWEEAYAHISPYFRVYGKPEYADSVMKIQTAQAILNGLTFRGRVSEPAAADSLTTVTSNVIRETGRYFSGYSSEVASNGLMYFAKGHLNLDDTCTWNHTIIVEAENPDTRTPTDNKTNSFIRTVDTDEIVVGISKNSYLEVTSSQLSKQGIRFNIPNVLAGKYDIYVDFVPPVIDGEAAAQQRCRVQFRLNIINSRNGNAQVTPYVTNNNWVIGGVEEDDSEDAEGETSAEKPSNGIVTIKAYEGYEFSFGEYYDGMWYLQDGNTTPPAAKIKLEVATDMTNKDEDNGFVRTFRVDRIRFVPVE